MKRSAIPALSDEGQQALDIYTTALCEHTDTSTATIRNYRSDLRQFIAWCERTWAAGQEHAPAFTPTALTTPLITRYRAYLQHSQNLKPASVNRALVSIKRYVAWAVETGQIGRNVALLSDNVCNCRSSALVSFIASAVNDTHCSTLDTMPSSSQ